MIIIIIKDNVKIITFILIINNYYYYLRYFNTIGLHFLNLIHLICNLFDLTMLLERLYHLY